MILFTGQGLMAQSLELMPGYKRIFADVQWLKFVDQEQKWSVFSRSRATVDYEDDTDLFSGAYLNYTTQAGVGVTLVGSISNLGAGGDAGLHLFKANKKIMLYALASFGLSSELSYSWFSILRFTPGISQDWQLYSSLELFSNFGKEGHVASVQRVRLGLDKKAYQFGVGINFSGLGKNYSNTDINPGLFIRKQF